MMQGSNSRSREGDKKKKIQRQSNQFKDNDTKKTDLQRVGTVRSNTESKALSRGQAIQEVQQRTQGIKTRQTVQKDTLMNRRRSKHQTRQANKTGTNSTRK
jgi:hypothetical protein